MNEDFVSFDLTKKLKEKGFKNNCIGYYDYAEEFHYNYESDIANKEIYFCHNEFDNIWHRDLVDAPTISQVLKWLREEKKMHVIIATFVDQLNRCYKWGYEIWDISEFPKHIQHVSVKTNFTGHDKAAIAGIEYVIDNLI